MAGTADTAPLDDAAPDPCPARVDPRVERTRAVVMETTRALLNEVGLERTSIEAVADRSGVARSTIYRHWPSTVALVMAALEQAKVEAEAGLMSSGDDETDLRALLDGLGEALRSPQSNVLADIAAAAGRDPELAVLHQAYLSRRRAAAVGLIERLQDSGRLRADVPAAEMVDLVAGPLFYRRFHAQRPMTTEQIAAHADLMFELLAPA
ncbi:TetR/AcrR family transcriptional regulator [Dermatobacter hominis]|uniref:TetR/AcrR family transcriptional regulator n=1 Tax=Dermatobacter hominis TaxID=2884263 RepID=UPI001D1058FF|nr:TetR/AcrR family transcriptional regulator [Dermatobacter hominis]UDY37836.1 TetR/AcrR family transcriptional regulator [Dermatobacter hominis]